MAISTAQEFLKFLEKSRLLTAEQLAAARQQSEQAGGNPRPLIDALLERRQLTRWQVNQLLAGQSNFFLGKYKLLDRIGAGGMGTVFKAEHVNMGRMVALKLISAELMNKPDSVARFRREVHMAAALHHPNIVTAYDADQVGRHHFLVMEYVEGSSLYDWLKQHGRLPIDWACECIRQAALGLEYAHRKGVVHRDVKPNNLLVVAPDTTGVPILKILDMGLARSAGDEHAAEELTHSDQVLGTPDYMSPEQAEDSRAADPRSDIFSLGCTLFKLLTGQVPYGGKSAMEKLTARIRSTMRREPAPCGPSFRPGWTPSSPACWPGIRPIAIRPARRWPNRWSRMPPRRRAHRRKARRSCCATKCARGLHRKRVRTALCRTFWRPFEHAGSEHAGAGSLPHTVRSASCDDRHRHADPLAPQGRRSAEADASGRRRAGRLPAGVGVGLGFAAAAGDAHRAVAARGSE